MKRFKFRLERVLDFRDSEKRERERELANRNHALRINEERLDGIIEASDSVQTPVGEPMTMAELKLAGEYQEALRNALIQQRLLIIEATKAVEDAREAYLEKSVEVKILEELKSRKKTEHTEEKKLEDRRELDELVVQRHKSPKQK